MHFQVKSAIKKDVKYYIFSSHMVMNKKGLAIQNEFQIEKKARVSLSEVICLKRENSMRYDCLEYFNYRVMSGFNSSNK